jgi:hypothetical protein
MRELHSLGGLAGDTGVGSLLVVGPGQEDLGARVVPRMRLVKEYGFGT